MLIPIKDNQPTFNKPYVTIALMVVNVLVFLYSRSLGAEGYSYFLYDWGFVPELFLDGGVTYKAPPWLYATPLTSMFLHGGWFHLIGNMLFLWIFGNNIEDYLGKFWFLAFYLVSGLAAVFLYTLPNPDSPVVMVGASGAIAGVMGAYMVLHPRARITCLFFFFLITFIELPAKVMLGIWFAIQAVSSLGQTSGGGVAYLAHVGGFVFGWLVFKLLVKIWGTRVRTGNNQQVYRMHW